MNERKADKHKHKAEILLDQYLQGKATKEQEALLQYWMLQQAAAEGVELSEERYAEKHAEMWGVVSEAISDSGTSLAKPKKLWQRIASHSAMWKVAAAVAAITLGVWLYTNEIASSRKAPRNDEVVVNDIAPGKNTATLTLADGKVINLDTNRTSVVIADSVKASTMLTASTPRGGQYQVVLPDGTQVWLNADSKLEFPSNFKNVNQRIVKLIGEAYFEAAKNKKIPFIVETVGSAGRPGQLVEVLGTHFNINSYPDESATKTTLLEGSVKVSSLREGTTKQPRGPSTEQGGAIVLKPNQQASLSGQHLLVKAIDPSEAVAWKNGYFSFTDESIQDIMQILARWYDIEVSYEGPVTTDGFNGKISRFKNISQVLNMLENTKLVHFKIEGRRVTVRQ